MKGSTRSIKSAASVLLRAGMAARLTRPMIRVLSKTLSSSDVQPPHDRRRRAPMGLIFVDIAGFTTWTARNGDEAAVELLDALERLIVRNIRSSKGKVIKRLGDGFFLAFPSASQAVRAALEIGRAVIATSAPLDGCLVRIGVHAGRPIVGADDVIGHDVNITSRLLDHCSPGRIVVSAAAKEAAERRLRTVEFRALSTVVLRGLDERCPIYSASRRSRAPASETA